MTEFAIFLTGFSVPLLAWLCIRIAERVELEQGRQAARERLRREFP